MMPRPITREELEEIGLEPVQIEEIIYRQKRKRDRKYKFIVELTISEANKLSTETGKKFIRATEWKKWIDSRMN
jgi:hypothetical protein